MTDQLVSFETAKMAKEVGFDERVCFFYSEITGLLSGVPHLTNGIKLNSHSGYRGDKKKKLYPYISAPTQSLLQKWLREEHNLLVTTGINRDKVQRRYLYYIDGLKDYELMEESLELFNSYEEAIEQGLQEALSLINK